MIKNAIWLVPVILGVVVFVLAAWRTAMLRRSGVLPAKGQGTMADVDRLIKAGHRVDAIRCYREIHGVSLVEAKLAVDKLVN
ncbi:MAG: hypothetical protein U1F65_06295 [Verrucomicrobiota bacterium]